MEEITADEVNKYINKALRNGVSFSLVNQIYSAVKLYYDKVAMDDRFEMQKLKRPRKSRRLPVYLSEGEVLRMIDSIDNVKHLCMLYLLYGSGLPRGETLNLELKDLLGSKSNSNQQCQRSKRWNCKFEFRNEISFGGIL